MSSHEIAVRPCEPGGWANLEAFVNGRSSAKARFADCKLQIVYASGKKDELAAESLEEAAQKLSTHDPLELLKSYWS